MLQEMMTTYRGYTLDPFQREAIKWLSEGESVLVSAPTGTGKTLIADYLVDLSYRSGRQVVYTAPIKALSNQKFKEFKALFGEEHVGILTGDVVRNPEATVLIMTTEIFRNLLHTAPERLQNTHYVIFDEIHYIDDPVRGSVWEESLIFMPDEMRFLGLSATIPNVEELAEWISGIHQGQVRIIRHHERAVPLEHHLYETALGECTLNQLVKRFKRYASKFGVTQSGNIGARFEPTRHYELIDHIAPDLLPCLYFTFSRRKCELNAKELAETSGFLGSEEQKQVDAVVDAAVERYGGAGARRVREIRPLLASGIGFHHAGLLPIVKDVVEELFERRLIRVLYCTETFAVGLNFPCRTVCFDAMTKWDGTQFRALSNREYFQMAGRAGRRGIDPKGYVYTAVDFNFFNPDQVPSMREEDVEPLRSRFTLSYNTVLNLVKNYSGEEIESILSSNFASFQAHEARRRLQSELDRLSGQRSELLGELPIQKADRLVAYQRILKSADRITGKIRKKEKAGDRRGLKALRREVKAAKREITRLERQGVKKKDLERYREPLREYRPIADRLERVEQRLTELPTPASFMNEFEEKKMLLQAMDYIREDELTARGLFAAEINGSELLITELFFRGIFHDWDEDQLNALASCVDYEPRKGEERPKQRPFDIRPVQRAVHLIQELEKAYLGFTQLEFNDHLAFAAFAWSQGDSFADVKTRSGTDDGDLVFGFRRAIDVIRQVRQGARQDEFIATKLSRCIERMDRDEVSILL